MASALKIVTAGALNTLPFGFVPKGVSSTLAVLIKNTGNTTLHVSAVSLLVTTGNASDFILNGFAGAFTVAPGAVYSTLTITFTPSSAFETLEQATLQFTSDSIVGATSFIVTGTCANPGTINSSAGANQLATANQAAVGSSTVNSAGATFAAYAIPTGARVTISLNVAITNSLSGTGAGVGKVQVSYNSGANWNDLYGSSSPVSTSLTFDITGNATNFNTVQVRASSFAIVSVPGGTSMYQTSLTSIALTSNVGGDDSVQIVYNYNNTTDTFPIADFGAVLLGSTYISSNMKIMNLTSGPLAITLTYDGSLGFSQSGAVTGTNPIPAGGTLIFAVQLIPPKGGNQDDLAAVTVTSGAAGFSTVLEMLYQAPVITPAFILTGTIEASVIALSSGAAATPLFFFDQNTECEDACVLSRQLYIDQPNLNKAVNRVFVLYEMLGIAVLNVSIDTVNPTGVPSVVNKQINMPNNLSGKLNIGVADGQVTGSVINFTFSKQSGLISLVGFLLKVDEIGEVIENT